ncbi:hypothetical protein ACJX0J_022260, partial [Zea mays]
HLHQPFMILHSYRKRGTLDDDNEPVAGSVHGRGTHPHKIDGFWDLKASGWGKKREICDAAIANENNMKILKEIGASALH